MILKSKNNLIKIIFRFTVLIITLLSTITADEFIVKSFSRLDNDLTARYNVVKDVNGDKCALIRVRTDIITPLQFDTNMGIPRDVVLENPGEYLVYISQDERVVKFMAEGFLLATFPLIGVGKIEPLTVYELILTSKDIESKNIEKDLFALTFNLNVDGVYIQKDKTAPIKTTGTIAGFELARGVYSFIFQKGGYKTLKDTIHVNQSLQRNIVLSRGFSDYQAGLPGIIIVNSKPSGAEIYFNDQYVGVTPYQQPLTEGKYSLRISKEFYYDVENTFTMSPKLTKEIPEITLKPNFGYLSVKSSPSASEVYLNGSYKGKTPLNKFQLKNGIYEMIIKKNLYEEIKIQIIIEDKEIKENYSLDATFGALKVECKNVEGANVYINNSLIGQTPFLLDTLKYGTYDLMVSKELYKEYNERIDISGNLTSREVVLMQNHGILDIRAEFCNIYVNDQLIGNNSVIKAYSPGTYKIKAFMDDTHYPKEVEVFLGNGETRILEIEPDLITGSISIVANPIEANGANIYIDNILHADKAPAVITLPIGTYDIVIKHSEFLDEEINKIVIKENDYFNKTFTMRNYGGSLKQKENFWKIQKWIALGGTVLIGGLGAGGNYMGWQTHFDYQDAISPEEAIRLRKVSDAYFLGRDISYGISISSLLYSGFSFIQELRFKEYQKPDTGFLENIFGSYKLK